VSRYQKTKKKKSSFFGFFSNFLRVSGQLLPFLKSKMASLTFSAISGITVIFEDLADDFNTLGMSRATVE
jgi:hypothetical protein